MTRETSLSSNEKRSTDRVDEFTKRVADAGGYISIAESVIPELDTTPFYRHGKKPLCDDAASSFDALARGRIG
jgi:hypothetical protein